MSEIIYNPNDINLKHQNYFKFIQFTSDDWND